MNINLADEIRMVRAIKAKMKAMEDEFEAKLKPYKEFVEQHGALVLQHLLQTGQKSASTPEGGVHWKDAITYRVEDKDEFRAYVISENAWELITWAAAGVAAEEYTQKNEKTPPGTVRNAIRKPYFTAPPKSATKVKGGGVPSEGAPVGEIVAMGEYQGDKRMLEDMYGGSDD